MTESPRRRSQWHEWWSIFRSDRRPLVGLILLAVLVAASLAAPWLTPYNPSATVFTPFLPPSGHHWLGTTANGQDVFAQFVYGGRISLAVGFVSGFVATALAVLLGMLPAYWGGRVDTIFATFTNIMLVIPGLPLLIVITAYVHQTGPFTIALVIGLTGWPWGARILRSQTLSLAQRDFVVAARLAGENRLTILLAEILPNMLSLVAANFVFATIAAILAEASLEFLGLGNPNAVTWGTMLYWAQTGQALLNGAWWWFVPPGLGIALVGLSLSLINFGIDQISNPRLRVSNVRRQRSEPGRPALPSQQKVGEPL
ncbi:binding-protein-dependent transport systems inner membrane component [Sulfobacillus acidophilus TPY]|uniref:ABC-type transporter, integral membrane subunit n=1 Tax=Sulfobacillus acidophilus (strain ATCC 700253 / DSM 10332 / NAL) TaxID=679936 RepID=G8TSA5_SULAD|nr:binding-protein-dependent transport systems inner membrane component [Sulfobacillus acidophilus TPY]AEW05517.1 ABC-type transporter, integral membrane subunit [Sulfobacillus acidophilus DSM 10332]